MLTKRVKMSFFSKCLRRSSNAMFFGEVHVKRCSDQEVGGWDNDVEYIQKCSQITTFTKKSQNLTPRRLDNAVPVTSKCCGARLAASGPQCVLCMDNECSLKLSLCAEQTTQNQSKHRESDYSGKANLCDRHKWCSHDVISAPVL